MGLTYAFSIVNSIFRKCWLEIIFCFSLLILNYWCSITILCKFQKFRTTKFLKKFLTPNHLPNRCCIICSHFYYRKNGNVRIFWNYWKGRYDKMCCIESCQDFANVLLLRKAPRKIKALTALGGSIVTECRLGKCSERGLKTVSFNP